MERKKNKRQPVLDVNVEVNMHFGTLVFGNKAIYLVEYWF
jgi:hypothetical protein